MAPPPPWSDGLAVELLLLILAKLCCLADRASFASVCHQWLEAAKLAKSVVPRQIPLLLFSSPSHDVPSIFSFLSGVRRKIRSLPADIRCERLCGSHPGGWVAVALSPFGRHQLFKVSTGARVDLPQRMRVWQWNWNGNELFWTVTPFLIRAIMLSTSPTAGVHCIAGAMVCGTSNVAFCRPGVDMYWYGSFPEVEGLQDMVYYEGEAMQGFHVVTDLEEVWVFNFSDDGDVLCPIPRKYKMPERALDKLFSILPRSASRTSYLVVSRNNLLMVHRYYSYDCRTGKRRTLLFRIFEMRVKILDNNRASWMELDSLDGRVLFLGRGCSRAYEASELHGFSCGSIYFLDDAKFDIMPLLQKEAEHPCADMGMYSMSGGVVVRPSLDALPAVNPAIYCPKTNLYWVNNENANEKAKKSLVEMRDGIEPYSGSTIIGTLWGFQSKPQSKYSPPIWFCP